MVQNQRESSGGQLQGSGKILQTDRLCLRNWSPATFCSAFPFFLPGHDRSVAHVLAFGNLVCWRREQSRQLFLDSPPLSSYSRRVLVNRFTNLSKSFCSFRIARGAGSRMSKFVVEEVAMKRETV